MWKKIFAIWSDTILLRAFMPPSWLTTAHRNQNDHLDF